MGPKGLMMTIRSLPFLGALGVLNDVEEYVNKNAPLLYGGAFGYIGNVSGMASIALPTTLMDTLGGVFIKDVVTALTPFFQGKDMVAPITGIESLDQITADNKVAKVAAVSAKGIQDTVIIVKALESAIDAIMDKDGNIYDDRHQKVFNLYDSMDTETEKKTKLGIYAATRVAGLKVPQEAAASTFLQIENRRAKRLTENKSQLTDKICGYLRHDENIPDSIINAAFVEYQMDRESLKKDILLKARTPEEKIKLAKGMDAKIRWAEFAPSAEDFDVIPRNRRNRQSLGLDRE